MTIVAASAGSSSCAYGKREGPETTLSRRDRRPRVFVCLRPDVRLDTSIESLCTPNALPVRVPWVTRVARERYRRSLHRSVCFAIGVEMRDRSTGRKVLWPTAHVCEIRGRRGTRSHPNARRQGGCHQGLIESATHLLAEFSSMLLTPCNGTGARSSDDVLPLGASDSCRRNAITGFWEIPNPLCLRTYLTYEDGLVV